MADPKTDAIALTVYQAMTKAAADPANVTTDAATAYAETIVARVSAGPRELTDKQVEAAMEAWHANQGRSYHFKMRAAFAAVAELPT